MKKLLIKVYAMEEITHKCMHMKKLLIKVSAWKENTHKSVCHGRNYS